MGELTQSFAQVSNAINQTKQTNLNRDIASSNISFRNQQSDIQERQFAAQQAQAQQQFQLDRADKAFDMASKLLTVAPPAEREGLMNGLLSSYAQATGKEYTPVQLAKYDETRAQLWGLGDQPEKAAEVVRQFEQNSIPGDPNVQRLRNEFLLADVHNRKNNTGSLTGLNKLGRVMSQSSFDRAMEDPDKDMARSLRDKKESGEINVVPDDLAMSLNLNEARDARFNALDPEVASKLIRIELGTLDPNMLSGDPEVDKLVATNNYLTGMDEIDAMLQANMVPPASKYRQVQKWAALADNKNLPSPVLSEQDREKMLASKAQREHLQKRNESITANINEVNTRLGNNNLVVQTMLSKINNIQQDTANAKIAGEAALLATEADRRKLEATAPEKIQRMTEIDHELHEIGQMMGNPTALGQLQQDEVEALSDKKDLLMLEQEVLENTMAFASAKDPSLLLEHRDNLKASTELLEAKKQDLLSQLKNNGKSLNGLELSRLANLDQKTQIEADKFKGEQLTNQLSNQIDPNDPNALRQAQDLIRNTPGADQLTNPKRVVDAAGGSSKGSGEAKGNTIFESASQAVKDVLLSKPGDLMHKATWRDVADAHRQVHLDRIEVQVGAMTAKKDQEVIRSAGEIFGIIDTFKDLGQSLFTDNEFLRLSGVQGAKQTFESYRQKDPRVKEYIRLREGLAGHLSRIGGERGMMTEGDIERAKNFVPDPTAFVPDSLETFNNMMRDFEQFVTNKVRGRFDERAVSALRGGSTSDRQEANSVEDILTEARKRAGVE